MPQNINMPKVALLGVFSVSMAYVEAMVVVYLRRLIPFQDLSKLSIAEIQRLLRDNHIYFEEQTREAATILMLLALAVVSGRTLKEKAAAFLWTFALWDIFYYIFLKLWTGWPSSLMDMDVLFLIPGPWVSPVIVPLAISLIMAVLSIVLFGGGEKAKIS